MTKQLDDFYLKQNEPIKSCFLALKSIILAHDPDITNEWKYGMPFFCFKGKMFCYLWIQKSDGLPYLGIVEGNLINHPDLIAGNRARMKILLFDPAQDLPINTLHDIIINAIDLYKTGKIKVK